MNVRFILATFGFGELTLVAFGGKHVDMSLGLGIKTVIDKLACEFGSEYTPEWVHDTLEDWSIESFHKVIVLRLAFSGKQGD